MLPRGHVTWLDGHVTWLNGHFMCITDNPKSMCLFNHVTTWSRRYWTRSHVTWIVTTWSRNVSERSRNSFCYHEGVVTRLNGHFMCITDNRKSMCLFNHLTTWSLRYWTIRNVTCLNHFGLLPRGHVTWEHCHVNDGSCALPITKSWYVCYSSIVVIY